MRSYVLRTANQVHRLVRILQATWKERLDAGRPLEVVVTEFTGRRSDAQNRLYWARLEQVSQQVVVDGRRYPKECWHEFLARRFIGYSELPSGGMLALSTTTLDVAEFSDYLGKIEAWAVEEHGVVFDEED